MKDSVWNLLTVMSMMALILVAAIFVQIFVNPQTAVNPFPPVAQPTLLVLPSATPTLRQLPPTWTPTPPEGAIPVVKAEGLRPSSTIAPTSTGWVMATFTNTPTNTATPTNTPTVTKTPTNTLVPTYTPYPTYTPVPTETPVPPTDTPTVTATTGGVTAQ